MLLQHVQVHPERSTVAGSQQQLRQDFQAYLDSFSHDIQDILDSFKFRNQIPTRFQPYFPEKTAVGIRSVTWRSGASRVAPTPTTTFIKLRSLNRYAPPTSNTPI
jgi:hypothetical protein